MAGKDRRGRIIGESKNEREYSISIAVKSDLVIIALAWSFSHRNGVNLI